MEQREVRSGVAVVTDAISPEFTFPIWHRYYGNQFGYENLFVLTHDGSGSFGDFTLGDVKPISGAYNDDVRAAAVSNFVGVLLARYAAVVRVDVDEFLVVDPSRHRNLRSYVFGLDIEYITSQGFDIIQGPEDTAVDVTRPTLEQRRLAFALTAMNKTAIVRRPLRWGRGFHYCSAPPILGDVYLFHLKRFDLARQRDWASGMTARLPPGSFEAKYYEDDLRISEDFVRNRWLQPCASSEDALSRDTFNAHFEAAIRFNASNGLFEGPYDIESENVLIPGRFSSIF